MARIALAGKYAVGDHAFAIVDDDAFVFLSQWRWKAKPNGNGTQVYAVRVECSVDGMHRDIRMHRVVAGYDGPLDIDHINRNPLDNRRANLRIVTRSANQLNRRLQTALLACAGCGVAFRFETKAGIDARRHYCSKACRRLAMGNALTHEQIVVSECSVCAGAFVTRRQDATFCSESCRKKAKWKRRRDAGTLWASASAEAQRMRRARRRHEAQRV